MNPKHTPAPWKQRSRFTDDHLIVRGDDEDRAIAEMKIGGHGLSVEGRANYDLMTASPLLFDALLKIVNNWGNLHPKDRQQAEEALKAACPR